jgi:hypothetical protein
MKHTLFLFLFLLTVQLPAQQLQWAINGGGDGNDKAEALAFDQAGNIYVTGSFRDTADLDQGPGVYQVISEGGADIFVAKLNAAGVFQWGVTMGGNSSESGSMILTDSDGNIYVCGSFPDNADFDPGPGVFILNPAGEDDVFIVKLDPSGNLIWAKRVGGPETDLVPDMVLDADANIYLTGSFRNTADFDPGAGTHSVTSNGVYDAYVLKLDSAGDFQWMNQMGGGGFDNAYSIEYDANGFITVCGSFQITVDFDPGSGSFPLSTLGADDIFVQRLDLSGNMIWTKQLGGSGEDNAYGIGNDAAGNIYVSGTFTGTADFDPGAATNNLTSAGAKDIFIIKLDMNGNHLWSGRMGGTTGDYCYSVTTDASGNVYATGTFTGTADFDPGAGVFNLASFGSSDIYVLRLDASGNFGYAIQLGGTDTEYTLGVYVQGNDFLVAGAMRGTGDYDPGSGTYNLTSLGGDDIFIGRYESTPSGLLNLSYENSKTLSIYPNPFRDETKISWPGINVKNPRLLIYDQKGNLISEYNVSNQSLTLLAESLAPGIYNLILTDDQTILSSGKLTRL